MNDAPKKSATDGMVKCLSMLGFAGDIFSGQWDDSKYVAWAVHCRIGSSEKHGGGEHRAVLVHCRIGSSEITRTAKAWGVKVHCRIGSSEMK